MNLGLYEVPEWGITGVPDRALFDAIRTFQKGTQLKTDGVMKPGGKTETTLKTAAELVRRHGRNGDTILAHISPTEAELLHRVTDGGSINPETGLPEFFLGSILGGLASSFVGSFAGPAAGSLVGSALSSFAAPVIDKYVSKKVGKKIGGPLGEIAVNTLGGYLGSGSLADIGGGLGQSFGNAVGGYAKRKVSEKIGGPLGDNIGDMLGSNLSGAVGGVAANGLTNAFGLEAKPTSQPTAQHAPSPISDGVKDLLNPDFSSARTPDINPSGSRQSPARPTASTAPILGSPARTSSSKPQPQQQTPWLPPLLAAEPRVNTQEIKGKQPTLDLPAEILSSNARTADALMKTSNFSAIKPHIQDAWTNGGEQGRAEVMNLAQQMKDRNLEHGVKFEKDMGLKETDALDFGHDPFAKKSTIAPDLQVADNSVDAFKPLKDKVGVQVKVVPQDRFDTLYEKLHTREGGYVNHLHDYGGETNHGVTKKTLGRYQAKYGGLGKDGKDVAIKTLSRQQAKTVYKNAFYDHYRIDEIENEVLAEDVLDLHTNSRPDTAAKILQKSINDVLPSANLEVDGLIGSETIGALNKASSEERQKIHDAINLNRAAFYQKRIQEDPTQEDFDKGWRNRLDSLE